jgi:2-phosphosulfolactate phosphatase
VTPSFVIDSFPERARLYRATHAIVAVDVFRASTTILTALAGGRRVFATSSVGQALTIAASLPGAWLAGEQDGVQPQGFDLQNSPAAVALLPDRCPLVLVSSAGALLLDMAAGAAAVEVEAWRGAELAGLRAGASAEYLRSTGQEDDIDYVLAHVEDVSEAAVFDGSEVRLVREAAPGSQEPREAA